MTMNTHKTPSTLRRERQQLLGELLFDSLGVDARDEPLAMPEESDIDRKLTDEGNLEFVAGGEIGAVPEFRQHECWRMLLVWPDEADETIPGRIECQGCGALFRVELEHKP